jgi:chromosome segregation ATPase
MEGVRIEGVCKCGSAWLWWVCGEGRADGARGLTSRETGKQVIRSKETEIEDLNQQLAEATDIIRSKDDTISARDAQIASLQNDLDDLREQLFEAKGKAEADLRKSKVCVYG